MAHRSQSCQFLSEDIARISSPFSDIEDSDNEMDEFDVDQSINGRSPSTPLGTPKRRRLADAQHSFLSDLFTVITQGYNWMFIVCSRETPASRPFKRFKLDNGLSTLRIPELKDEDASEVESELAMFELESLYERRIKLQRILDQYEPKIKHPLVRLMNRLRLSMKPSQTPVRPTSARLAGFTYTFDNHSKKPVYTSVFFSHFPSAPPRDFSANPHSHPHKDPKYNHFTICSSPRSIINVYAQNTYVEKYNVRKDEFSRAYKVLCKLFVMHQTGKVSNGSGIWNLSPILGGRWCQPFLFTPDQAEFVDGISNDNLIIKTVHYQSYCKNKSVSAEDMVRFLYLSYATYMFVESYKTPSGKRIYQAKMYNKPHLDGYMVCERLHKPCHPVHWSYTENESYQLILSTESHRKLDQLRDYFYVAFCLAKDEGILIDLSPMNIFYKSGRYYLIDTLGIPINVSPLGFLYERLLYWSVLDGKPDRRIFEMLIIRFPEDLQEIFRTTFPRKNEF